MIIRSMLFASAFLLAAGATSIAQATSSPQTATARKMPAAVDLLARNGADDGAKHHVNDVRDQRQEDRGQRQEDRNQRQEDRSQRQEDRSQRQEDRGTRETEPRGTDGKGSDGGRSGGGNGGNRR